MTSPSVTYTFSNGSTSDATAVNQNFSDIINALTDGTKSFSIDALTCAGAASLTGHVTLGSAAADDLTINASLASSIPIKTTNTYDIGSATLGLAGIYFGTADTDTARVVSAALAASRTYTMPDAGANASFVMTAGAQSIAGVKTFSDSTDATTATAGGTIASGGLAVAKKIISGDVIYCAEEAGITSIGQSPAAAFTLAAGASKTITLSGTSGIIVTREQTNGVAAVHYFYVAVSTTITFVDNITAAGSAFAESDTADRICLIGAASQQLTIKNNKATSYDITLTIIGSGA